MSQRIPGVSQANLPMPGGLHHCPGSGSCHTALSAGNAVCPSQISVAPGYHPGEKLWHHSAMTSQKILIIEDDEDIRELLVYNLEKNGYEAEAVESGETGLASAISHKPDLILLDLMLPGVDGLSVCRQLKAGKETHDVPIIIISAKGEETDIITGLELGADDYLAKPFSPNILLSRVRAVLRRIGQTLPDETAILKAHDLDIDPKKFKAMLAGQPLNLTASEFRILYYLASHRGWVFTRYQIMDAIRGEGYVVTERAIDVQIAGLRKKLGEYSGYIETVRGVGYRFLE
jgi:two-component system phosphate regulon response regulator PhoB